VGAARLCRAENSSVSSLVCLESIGAVGWYSERYILDSGGLVSPEVVSLNRVSSRGRHDFPAIVQQFRPDYYVAWEGWELRQFKADPSLLIWLEQNYREIHRFTDGVTTWVLFERRIVSVPITSN
jgi:hypothetical protein